MKMIKLKCPDCGAILTVNESLKTATCNFCGSQIYLDDEIKRSEHIIRNIDEARIRESDNSVKLARLKAEEKQKNVRILIIITAVAFIFMFLFFILSIVL